MIKNKGGKQDFAIGKGWGLRVEIGGYLVLRFNEQLTVSLEVKELDTNIATAAVLNIRKEGVIDPIGELAIRAECVRDLPTWRQKTLRMMNLRKHQLDRLLE